MTIYKSSASWPQMLTKKPKLLSWLSWKDGQKNSRTHKLPDFLPKTRSVKTAGFLFGSLTHEDTKNKAHSIEFVGFLHSKMDVIWTLKNKIHLFSNS